MFNCFNFSGDVQTNTLNAGECAFACSERAAARERYNFSTNVLTERTVRTLPIFTLFKYLQTFYMISKTLVVLTSLTESTNIKSLTLKMTQRLK